MNILNAVRYLRLTSFDTTTEQGRSDERYRLAAISIGANVLSKGLAMVVMLLSVRLTVPYLGVERFGVWMTVASFAGLLTFLDLGVGNALTNHVAQRAATDNQTLLRQTITGGLAFLGIIGSVMGAVLWWVAAYLPWETFIKVIQPDLLIEARLAAMSFALLFGFNIFTNGIQRIFAGLQQAYMGHLVSSLGSLVAGIGLWLAATNQADIPTLLVVMLGSQSGASLLLLFILIYRRQFGLNGIAKSIKLETPFLFHTGWLFFLLQIGTMAGWGADALIVSSTLGVAQVATLNVTQRLFQFISQPLSIMNAPLWGAYADANSRKDRKFIKRTLKRSMGLTLGIGAILSVCLLFLSDGILRFLTKDTLIVSVSLISIYAIWTILDVASNAFSMFMNGCNIIRPQVLGVAMLILVALPVKLYLASSYGLVAMLVGFVLVYVVNIYVWYGIIFRKHISDNLN